MLPCAAKNAPQTLGKGEIHIWSSRLDQPGEVIEDCRRVLTIPDLERIERYKTAQLRNRHTVARGLLISLIALYTKKNPRQVRLQSNEFQRPVLVDDLGATELQFSLSHSNHMGLYAFTRGALIGVDLEENMPMADWHGVKSLCLSDYEKGWFSQFPPERQFESFLQIWTIKEAYLKAIGTGLAIPPTNIEVEFTEGHGFRFHKTKTDGNDNGRIWTILPLSQLPGFSAAVVVEGEASELRYFYWEPELPELRVS
jgi:4'-phosphopantetheinyl transferase